MALRKNPPVVVPVMRPRLATAAKAAPYLVRMDSTGVYANRGPLVVELEARLARFLSVTPDQVVLTTSATMGLTGAVAISGVRRWLAPSFTFPATGLAVLAGGAALSLSDVDDKNWALASGACEGQGVGLIPVLPFGQPMHDAWWSDKESVIVDAAAALGTMQGSLAQLPRSWVMVFSLHATKVLPAGEGGLVVFGDPDRAKEFRRWTNFGFDDQRVSVMCGQNAKMPEIAAAYGLASLDDWAQESSDWLEASKLAIEAVSNIPGLDLQVQQPTPTPYCVVRVSDTNRRTALMRSLTRRGIETRVWWTALHRMPAFGNCKMGDVGVSDDLASTTLGLPLFRGYDRKTADAVHAAVVSAFSSM